MPQTEEQQYHNLGGFYGIIHDYRVSSTPPSDEFIKQLKSQINDDALHDKLNHINPQEWSPKRVINEFFTRPRSPFNRNQSASIIENALGLNEQEWQKANEFLSSENITDADLHLQQQFVHLLQGYLQGRLLNYDDTTKTIAIKELIKNINSRDGFKELLSFQIDRSGHTLIDKAIGYGEELPNPEIIQSYINKELQWLDLNDQRTNLTQQLQSTQFYQALQRAIQQNNSSAVDNILLNINDQENLTKQQIIEAIGNELLKTALQNNQNTGVEIILKYYPEDITTHIRQALELENNTALLQCLIDKDTQAHENNEQQSAVYQILNNPPKDSLDYGQIITRISDGRLHNLLNTAFEQDNKLVMGRILNNVSNTKALLGDDNSSNSLCYQAALEDKKVLPYLLDLKEVDIQTVERTAIEHKQSKVLTSLIEWEGLDFNLEASDSEKKEAIKKLNYGQLLEEFQKNGDTEKAQFIKNATPEKFREHLPQDPQPAPETPGDDSTSITSSEATATTIDKTPQSNSIAQRLKNIRKIFQSSNLKEPQFNRLMELNRMLGHHDLSDKDRLLGTYELIRLSEVNRKVKDVMDQTPDVLQTFKEIIQSGRIRDNSPIVAYLQLDNSWNRTFDEAIKNSQDYQVLIQKLQPITNQALHQHLKGLIQNNNKDDLQNKLQAIQAHLQPEQLQQVLTQFDSKGGTLLDNALEQVNNNNDPDMLMVNGLIKHELQSIHKNTSEENKQHLYQQTATYKALKTIALNNEGIDKTSYIIRNIGDAEKYEFLNATIPSLFKLSCEQGNFVAAELFYNCSNLRPAHLIHTVLNSPNDNNSKQILLSHLLVDTLERVNNSDNPDMRMVNQLIKHELQSIHENTSEENKQDLYQQTATYQALKAIALQHYEIDKASYIINSIGREEENEFLNATIPSLFKLSCKQGNFETADLFYNHSNLPADSMVETVLNSPGDTQSKQILITKLLAQDRREQSNNTDNQPDSEEKDRANNNPSENGSDIKDDSLFNNLNSYGYNGDDRSDIMSLSSDESDVTDQSSLGDSDRPLSEWDFNSGGTTTPLSPTDSGKTDTPDSYDRGDLDENTPKSFSTTNSDTGISPQSHKTESMFDGYTPPTTPSANSDSDTPRDGKYPDTPDSDGDTPIPADSETYKSSDEKSSGYDSSKSDKNAQSSPSDSDDERDLDKKAPVSPIPTNSDKLSEGGNSGYNSVDSDEAYHNPDEPGPDIGNIKAQGANLTKDHLTKVLCDIAKNQGKERPDYPYFEKFEVHQQVPSSKTETEAKPKDFTQENIRQELKDGYQCIDYYPDDNDRENYIRQYKPQNQAAQQRESLGNNTHIFEISMLRPQEVQSAIRLGKLQGYKTFDLSDVPEDKVDTNFIRQHYNISNEFKLSSMTYRDLAYIECQITSNVPEKTSDYKPTTQLNVKGSYTPNEEVKNLAKHLNNDSSYQHSARPG